MTFEVRDFRPDDYTRIERRRFDLITFQAVSDPGAAARLLATRGPAFTGLVDGEVIACGGILIFWAGVGEAWVVTSDLVDRYKLFFARTVTAKLGQIIREHRLERVQAAIDAEHHASIKWVEKMGFTNEGLMRKYLGRRDFYRYALVREE